MCIICIDIEKNKLTPLEALHNFVEMADSMEEEHVEEVSDLIYEYIDKSGFCIWCETTDCECNNKSGLWTLI